MNITSGLYANGSTGSSGQVLTSSSGGAMTWTTPSSFSGDIADYITHTGDSSAYFGFPFDDTFTITTNNTERFRINSIGGVVIATATSGYSLDVNGTMNITSGLYANGSTGSNGQVLTSSGGGAMSWTTVSSGGSSPWTTSGSNIYRSSGNVGIGTTNPLTPLHVVGNADITGGLRANGSTGSNGQVLTSSGGGAMSWTTVSSGSSFSGDIVDYITHTGNTSNDLFGFPNNNEFKIRTGGIDRLNIDSSGNLTIPDYIRHSGDTNTYFGFSSTDTFVVSTSGSVRFLVNAIGEGTIGLNTGMGSGHMFAVVDGSTSNDGSYADLVITNMSEHNNARLLLGTSHNTNSSSAFKAAIIADGAGTYSRNDLHFCLEGSTDNTANADLTDSKMMIKYDTGNVGIGTTTPGYKLDVNGNMNITSGLYANGSAGTSGQVLTSSGGGAVSWTTVSGGSSFSGDIADYITHTGDSDTKFGFPTTDTFTITIANIERLRINSSGEATFGSSSGLTMGTGHKMTIISGSTGSSSTSYADLVITNRNENNKARILLGTPYNQDSSSAFKAAIIADGVGSSSRCNLHFCLENTSSNTPNAEIADSKMVIKYDTGNVGIGTTSPAHKLHVVGDIYASGNVTAYSDARNKKNLKTIEDPVSKIEKINGYTYEKDGIAYTGLVAQELLEVLPEAVCGSEELGYGIAYGNIAGIFVEAIKELNSKIKALENKLSQIV